MVRYLCNHLLLIWFLTWIYQVCKSGSCRFKTLHNAATSCYVWACLPTCRNFSGVWWHPDLLHAMLLLIDQQIRIYIKINIWPVYNVGHFIWWTVITDHKRVGRRWGEDFSPYYPDFLHVMAKCKVAETRNERTRTSACTKSASCQCQGTDYPAYYYYYGAFIPTSWPLLWRPCLSPWTARLFHTPEIGLWFQPAVSRLAPISCTHTHTRMFSYLREDTQWRHTFLAPYTNQKQNNKIPKPNSD